MRPAQWRGSPFGVASGEITPGEAAELSKLIEAYVKALEASEFEQRLRVLEAKKDGKRL